ncbi:DAK2 domain-containing protein [Paenibacillus agricola]|uniref:DAK2 domain-containing protein n=1 Tax=Paenibacillus agricola TaxID=2716264 RepID=A0ABX0IZ78_9BACL|nr:DAK2 domain-containing protein [Paenibacillus agricola]NHN28441.1 DAK2 domain-containing protein [Paenibacillus agricola]
MSKRLNIINGNDFIRMIEIGAELLHKNAEKVNALNVFPVPDGDTGTNMNLTLTSGLEELRRRPSLHIGKSAEALAKGLLMGARGNSGVILSQLFRGFAKAIVNFEEINGVQLAAAFQQGVDMAYKAVVKPVEGTILTVAKEAAKHGVLQAGRITDVNLLMGEIQHKAEEALSKTPEQLAVLRQVGVVDAGGQGLLYIYNGFVQALGQDLGGTHLLDADYPAIRKPNGNRDSSVAVATAPKLGMPRTPMEPMSAQSKLATEDIEFGYCTEFMVTLNASKLKGHEFMEQPFRERLSALGDSLLVVSDDELVRVHIHAEYPGSVMNVAMEYGELSRIKIENMRDQHTHILMEELEHENQVVQLAEDASSTAKPAIVQATSDGKELKRYGFMAVSAGPGITSIFKSLGVDQVIHGGQSMNPSTEELVLAVNQIAAQTVFVFPNNSNIILAAQQAAQLVEDKTLIVVPTKTIPQGIAALFAFGEQEEPEANLELMRQAASQVQSGAVTYAVRDTSIDGMDIKQGDFIGIHNSQIVTAETDLQASCQKLVDALLADGGEVVTIYTGEEADEAQSKQLVDYVKQNYTEVEVEIHKGGQPVYYYLISAE